MNAFDQYEVWFVTGAQLLYGGDAVIAVDAHSNEMVNGLNESVNHFIRVCVSCDYCVTSVQKLCSCYEPYFILIKCVIHNVIALIFNCYFLIDYCP